MKSGHFLIQFWDETWKVSAYFLINYDLARTKKWVLREFKEELQRDREFAGISMECENSTGGVSDVVSIHDWDGSPNAHAILAHECLHVVCNVFDRRGLKQPDQEVICYFMESLVRRVLEGMQKRKKRLARNR